MTSTYDVGDAAPLRLTVNPAGPDTAVTVTVRTPSGATREIAAVPNDDRTQWATAVELDEPGVWSSRWVVTGTGAGAETHTIVVGPGDLGDDPRAYATTADLARYLRAAPPVNGALLLARASARVDELLVCSRYDVDDDGRAAHLRLCGPRQCEPGCIAGAIRDATCAQAAALDELGDETGNGVAALGFTDVSIGSVRLAGGRSADSGAGGSGRYSSAAVSHLRRAGLLTASATAPVVTW